MKLLSHHESMARVLLTGFCSVPGPRRTGVQLRHVIRSLMQHHTVDLLVAREGDQSYVERSGNIRILRVPVAEGAPGGPTDLTNQIQSFQRALKRQLDGAEYDVVHCCDSWTGFIVLEAKRRLDCALIYDLTRSPVGETAPDPDLDARYSRYEQACLRSADVVLAPTRVAASALGGLCGGNVVLSPPGVDVDRFDWDEPPPIGAPRIVYTGSIDAHRGVHILIRAMAALAQEGDAQLVLAGPMGSPQFARALEDQIRGLGLTDRVELIGPVDHDQIPTLLATATVCVVPSASDLAPNPTAMYPTKLLEYLACRRAVVAPRRETVALVVNDQQEALLFDPGDPMDLARNILRLLDDRALRDRIASAGYDRVRREFPASAARRALRGAYAVFSDRFKRVEVPVTQEEQKGDLLGEDDFEATVIESAADVVAGDTGLQPLPGLEVLDEVLETLDASQPALPIQPAANRLDTVRWAGVTSGSPSVAEESGVTNVVAASWSRGATEEDGTPAEGLGAPGVFSARDSVFVAGEIDVPTPTPQVRPPTFDESVDSDTGIKPARRRN